MQGKCSILLVVLCLVYWLIKSSKGYSNDSKSVQQQVWKSECEQRPPCIQACVDSNKYQGAINWLILDSKYRNEHDKHAIARNNCLIRLWTCPLCISSFYRLCIGRHALWKVVTPFVGTSVYLRPLGLKDMGIDIWGSPLFEKIQGKVCFN